MTDSADADRSAGSARPAEGSSAEGAAWPGEPSGRVFDGRARYGRDYEDFVVGDLYRHWPGRTVTEYDDTLFAQLTMNQHPLHSDAAYAAGTQFGQRLVVGTFVFSLVVGMTVADVSGRAVANLEYESVRHEAPVVHGDTLYAETRVLAKRPTADGRRGVVLVETRGFNQRGETVITLRRRVLVTRRDTQ
jgi:acyl dehydratase